VRRDRERGSEEKANVLTGLAVEAILWRVPEQG
jgi:hypothetical protein